MKKFVHKIRHHKTKFSLSVNSLSSSSPSEQNPTFNKHTKDRKNIQSNEFSFPSCAKSVNNKGSPKSLNEKSKLHHRTYQTKDPSVESHNEMENNTIHSLDSGHSLE